MFFRFVILIVIGGVMGDGVGGGGGGDSVWCVVCDDCCVCDVCGECDLELCGDVFWCVMLCGVVCVNSDGFNGGLFGVVVVCIFFFVFVFWYMYVYR